MVALTKKTKKLIGNVKELRLAIMSHYNIIDNRTLDRWVNENNPKLISEEVLMIIEDITGVPTSLLTEKHL